jgi:hypothetical protein
MCIGCHPTAAERDGILPLGWASMVFILEFQTGSLSSDWVSIMSLNDIVFCSVTWLFMYQTCGLWYMKKGTTRESKSKTKIIFSD